MKRVGGDIHTGKITCAHKSGDWGYADKEHQRLPADHQSLRDAWIRFSLRALRRSNPLTQ